MYHNCDLIELGFSKNIQPDNFYKQLRLNGEVEINPGSNQLWKYLNFPTHPLYT